MTGDGATGQVHVGAGGGLVGPDQADLLDHGLVLGLVGAHQAGQVVAVGERDAALAAGHGLDLVGVTALGCPGLVVDVAFQDLFGLLDAVMLDHRAEQRQVVGVAAGAGADLALVLGVGQRFVGGDILRVDAVLVVDDHAGAVGEAVPAAVLGTELGRDALLEGLGLDRLEQAGLLCVVQPRGIDQQDHVGRALVTFGLQALQQRLVLQLDAVDLDAGLLGEVGVEALVTLIVARGIEVEDLFLGLGGRGGNEQGGDGSGQQAGRKTDAHGVS